MRRAHFAAVVITLFASGPALCWAQPPARGYAFGGAGAGSLADDEGGLGSGVAASAGAGWWLSSSIAVEAAVSRVRHERDGSLAWRGTPATLTARVLKFWGSPAARVRPFAGGGGGYLRYTGTRTDTVFDAPTIGRTVDRDWHVQGLAIQGGGGLHINLTRVFFVRPEVWLTLARPERSGVAPEPPYTIPQVLLAAGITF
jgi:hypothetical protein